MKLWLQTCCVITDVDVKHINFILSLTWELTVKDGYLRCTTNGPYYKQCLHKLIAERIGLDSRKIIDHKDRDKLNNKDDNLREATYNQNNVNCRKYSNNTSGYKGIHFRVDINKWVAYIQINGKLKSLGHYIDLQEAINVRLEAEQKYYGEFANG